MSADVETQSNPLDMVKWAVTATLVIGGIAGFYYFPEQSQLVRVIGMLAAFGVAVFVALQTDKGRAGWAFFKDTRNEIRKVVWPTRKETIQTTGIVMVVVVILSIFLWLVDMFLGWAIGFVIGGN